MGPQALSGPCVSLSLRHRSLQGLTVGSSSPASPFPAGAHRGFLLPCLTLLEMTPMALGMLHRTLPAELQALDTMCEGAEGTLPNGSSIIK